MELKDECGCVVKRTYASDFLMKRLFLKGSKVKGEKLGEFRIDKDRWFRIYKGIDGKLYYESSECPLLVITLEALCERYLEKNGKMDFDDAIKKMKEVKGITINQIVMDVVSKVVGCLN